MLRDSTIDLKAVTSEMVTAVSGLTTLQAHVQALKDENTTLKCQVTNLTEQVATDTTLDMSHTAAIADLKAQVAIAQATVNSIKAEFRPTPLPDANGSNPTDA